MSGKAPAGVARDGRGNAAVEFAIVLPVLVALLGCLADFGLALWYKAVLAGSVAQGGHYAFLARAGFSTATIGTIQAVVGRRLSLPSADVAVSDPVCGCVSGTPAAFSEKACDTACPNGTTAGAYVTITARHTYAPIMPLYSKLAGSTLVEATTVRLR